MACGGTALHGAYESSLVLLFCFQDDCALDVSILGLRSHDLAITNTDSTGLWVEQAICLHSRCVTLAVRQRGAEGSGNR
jgi:hypothetical protein